MANTIWDFIANNYAEKNYKPTDQQVVDFHEHQNTVRDVPLAPLVGNNMNTASVDLSDRNFNQPTINIPQTPIIPTQPITPNQPITPQGSAPVVEKSPSMWDSTFGNEEWRLRKALALNSMRLNPDDSLATGLRERLKSIREGKGANKTVATIQQRLNTPGISDEEKARLQMILKGVQDGAITPSDAFTLALKRKSAPLVDMGGGEKYYDAIAKDIANMQTTWRERGELARGSLNALNELNTAISSFGETGPDAKTKQDIRELASRVGMGFLIDEQKMSDGQYVEAIKNRMVAEELRRNKGPQTDFDAKFAGTYIPGLGTSTKANTALMNYSKSISLQQTILANMSADIRLSDFDSAKQTIKTIDKLSLMSPGAMERPDGTWITFNEFFNADIDEIKKMSAQERLQEWSNRYKQRMGFK